MYEGLCWAYCCIHIVCYYVQRDLSSSRTGFWVDWQGCHWRSSELHDPKAEEEWQATHHWTSAQLWIGGVHKHMHTSLLSCFKMWCMTLVQSWDGASVMWHLRTFVRTWYFFEFWKCVGQSRDCTENISIKFMCHENAMSTTYTSSQGDFHNTVLRMTVASCHLNLLPIPARRGLHCSHCLWTRVPQAIRWDFWRWHYLYQHTGRNDNHTTLDMNSWLLYCVNIDMHTVQNCHQHSHLRYTAES